MTSARFWGCIVLLSAVRFASAGEPPVKKVLLIGIDGCRTDALEAAHAPNLHKLGKDGAMCLANDVLPDRKTGADSETLPGWTSMLTGVWADKHGVLDNSFRKTARYPTFLGRVRAARPRAETVALVSFRSIVDHIFDAEDGARMVLEGSRNGFDKADEVVATEAVKILETRDPTVLFVYFGQVDVAGHKHGFHPKVPQYVEAIAAVDRHVGRILTALAARPTYAKEDWLIVSSSDHGGRGLGHSGQQSHEEVRRVFLIMNGLSVDRANLPKRTANVDVAATALTHLGLPVPADFDGKSIGLKK